MEFNEQFSHPTPFAQMWAMYRDPAFSLQRMNNAGAIDAKATVDGDDDAFTIRCSGKVDPSMIPAVAQRIIRGDVTMDIQEVWHRTGDDSAKGVTSIRVNGAPVRVDANSTLSTENGETLRRMIGELQVQVPLLGRALEREAMGVVPQLIRAENKAVDQYQKSK